MCPHCTSNDGQQLPVRGWQLENVVVPYTIACVIELALLLAALRFAIWLRRLGLFIIVYAGWRF